MKRNKKIHIRTYLKNKSEWEVFRDAMYLAQEIYNTHILARKNRWLLFPDKWIGRAYFKYKNLKDGNKN